MTAAPKRITFEGSQGSELAARLDLPVGPPRAYAVFAHCFTCTKDVFAASRISAGLAEAGFAVLRFDFTGLGASGGDFANSNFSSNLEDLRRAAGWLTEHHRAPQLLVGHSLGGAAVLAVAGDMPSVRAVATVGAPSDVTHVEALLGDARDQIEANGAADVCLAGRTFQIQRQFLTDLRDTTILDRVAELRRALLVMHSPIDEYVSVDHAAKLFSAARHPRSFVSLDGADHLLTHRSDAAFAARMIGAWAERYIDDADSVPAPAPSAQVVVGETGQGVFLNHVVSGRHHLLADEPESVGGYDAGPSPYDLLAAALGACTSMTLRMYADRKKIDVGPIRVEVEHGKVHADDCAECGEGRAGMVDRIERRIEIPGVTDESHREALLRIADRCPVHRTLESSSAIVTTLID